MHSPVVLRRRPKKLLKRMKAISMGHRRLGRRSRWLMQEPAAVHPLPERSLRIQRLLTIPTGRPSRRTTTQQRPRRARCRRLLCRPCSNLIPARARGVLLPRLLLTRLLPGLFPEGGAPDGSLPFRLATWSDCINSPAFLSERTVRRRSVFFVQRQTAWPIQFW